jgi:ribonuclease PH
VDSNIVLTEGGDFVEIQGSGEEATFTQAQFDAMLILGRKGVAELCALQQQVIDSAMKPAEPTDLKKLADFFGKK